MKEQCVAHKKEPLLPQETLFYLTKKIQEALAKGQ